MTIWLETLLRRALARRGYEEGQSEIIIALVVLILILMLSGRRVVVQ